MADSRAADALAEIVVAAAAEAEQELTPTELAQRNRWPQRQTLGKRQPLAPKLGQGRSQSLLLTVIPQPTV